MNNSNIHTVYNADIDNKFDKSWQTGSDVILAARP